SIPQWKANGLDRLVAAGKTKDIDRDRITLVVRIVVDSAERPDDSSLSGVWRPWCREASHFQTWTLKYVATKPQPGTRPCATNRVDCFWACAMSLMEAFRPVFIALLLIALIWMVGSPRPPVAQKVQLVAAYSFDEGTGTTLTDLSGHGNTGTIVNAT